MIVLVFGDSIAYGAWDEEGGWAERLKRHLHKRVASNNEYHLVYNLAISGETSRGVLERLEKDASKRLEEGEETTMFLQIGMNDSAVTLSGEPVTSEEEFKHNVEQILTKAKKLFDEIVVLGLIQVDEGKTCPVPWADLCYKNERIDTYDEILRSVSNRKGAKYVALRNVLTLEDLSDGLHPNTHGHEKIFQIVEGRLKYKTRKSRRFKSAGSA